MAKTEEKYSRTFFWNGVLNLMPVILTGVTFLH